MKRLSFTSPRHSLVWLPVSLIVVALFIGAAMSGITAQNSSLRDFGTVSVIATPKMAQTLQSSMLSPVATVASVQRASTETSGCSQNGSGRLLLVSISQQHLWACDGTQLVNESAVTTGTTAIINGVDDNTPTGTWHIYSKQTNTVLRGCDANGCWNDPVQYWMPFDGEVGFHDASWQTFPFGASDYHTNGSHGCVHLPTPFAAWVYGWAPIGTQVTVEN